MVADTTTLGTMTSATIPHRVERLGLCGACVVMASILLIRRLGHIGPGAEIALYPRAEVRRRLGPSTRARESMLRRSAPDRW